jgi:hypothetical protein
MRKIDAADTALDNLAPGAAPILAQKVAPIPVRAVSKENHPANLAEEL